MRRLGAGGEDGYVIVIVMLLLTIALGLGAAALAETLHARDTATLTARSQRALQAADAGLQTGLYRFNQMNLGSQYLDDGLSLSTVIGQLLTCPVPQVDSSGQITGLSWVAVASVGSPCPSNASSGTAQPYSSKEPVGDHAYYDVRVIPGATNIGDFIEYSPKIVSLGIDDGGPGSSNTITRRIDAILNTYMPWRTLEAVHDLTFDIPGTVSVGGVLGVGSTTFNGTAAAGNNLNINGPSGVVSPSSFTAANVSLSGGLTEPSALDYCNTLNETNVTVTLTAGHLTKPSSGCSSLVNRSTISIASSKADCAPVTGVVDCGTLLGTSYTSATDSVYCATTTGCPTLTLQPGDYVFCDFQYNGPIVFNASSTQAVRIFIDNPNDTSRCGSAAGISHGSSSVSGFQTNYGNFVAPHGVSNVLSTAYPSRAQVYVVGNGTNDGTVAYATGDTTLSSEDMFLYAPTSNVTVSGGQTCVLTTCVNSGTLAGAFVGYDLTASGTAVTEDLGLLNDPLSSTLGTFYIKQYIECSAVTSLSSSDPAGGC